jgi:hypothetical protein
MQDSLVGDAEAILIAAKDGGAASLRPAKNSVSKT